MIVLMDDLMKLLFPAARSSSASLPLVTDGFFPLFFMLLKIRDGEDGMRLTAPPPLSLLVGGFLEGVCCECFRASFAKVLPVSLTHLSAYTCSAVLSLQNYRLLFELQALPSGIYLLPDSASLVLHTPHSCNRE
nr:hypothetical protein Iba_chr03cCG0910 [Ipomoea batatas]